MIKKFLCITVSTNLDFFIIIQIEFMMNFYRLFLLLFLSTIFDWSSYAQSDCSVSSGAHLNNLKPLHRLRDSSSGVHKFYYTELASEKDTNIEQYSPWSFDKAIGYVSSVDTPQTGALYRLRTPSGSYYLTPSLNEKNTLIAPPYNFLFERIIGYSFISQEAGTWGLRKFRKSGGNHEYVYVVDSQSLRDYWTSEGYIDLGIVTYVACTANNTTQPDWPRLDAQPSRGDLLTGAIYHPGWEFSESVNNVGSPNNWRALNRPYQSSDANWNNPASTSFVGRKPKLGWYNGAQTDVIDWEIKWALEHGVQFFAVNWYRQRYAFDTTGIELRYPVDETLDDTLAALKNSQFNNIFQHAIIWENQNRAALSQNRNSPNKAQARNELLNVYYPYWRDNLFSNPNYLRVDGKPLLYVFSFTTILNDFQNDKGYMKTSLDMLRQQAASDTTVNMEGLIVVCGDNGLITSFDLSEMDQAGCDSAFSYYVAPGSTLGSYTPVQAFNSVLNYNTTIKNAAATLPAMFSMSVSWLCTPKTQSPINQGCGYDYLLEPFLSGWGNSYDDGLQWISGQLSGVPLVEGRRFIMLDAWNEWVEGHAIAPSELYGFAYLNKVRRWLSSAAAETNSQQAPSGTSLQSLQSDWCGFYPASCPYSCSDNDGDGICNGNGDL